MKVFLIIFVCFLNLIVTGQESFKYQHFTTDDGLPTNTIYQITEDNKGNIVVGTDNGLSVFNGNFFKNYNVKDGLINPYIVAVSRDENGTVWFLNYNKNLQKLVNNGIINTNITALYYNHFSIYKNNIFFYNFIYQTKNHFSFKEFNLKTQQKQTVVYNHKSPKIVLPILIQNNHIIKIKNNILVYNQFKIPLFKEIKHIHKVIFRKNDVCILEQDFLFIVDFKGKIIHQIRLPKSLFKDTIYKYDFIVDNQENCWLNIQNKGLFLLKSNAWINVNYQLNLNFKDNINFLYEDKKGRFWIATHENGLYCINNKLIENIAFENQKYFTSLATDKSKNRLFATSVFKLYEYQNNNLKDLRTFDSEVKLSYFNDNVVVSNRQIKTTKTDSLLGIYFTNYKQIFNKKNNNLYGTGLYGGYYISKFKKEKVYEIKKIASERITNVVFYKNNYYVNNSEKIVINQFNDSAIWKKRDLKSKIKGFIQDFKFINDTMFVATDAKVYKLFNEKIVDSIDEINTKKVVNVRKIKQINNQVYLCSNDGLFILSKTGSKILNKYNFLASNEVFDAEILNNELFVATKSGLAKINLNLANLKTEKPTFDVLYRSKKINNITIKCDQNYVKLNLEIQNFNAVKNQIIQYKSDAINWINTEFQYINFNTSSFGDHKVQIRIRDVNSEWEMQTVTIYKLYPFYLKWWFMLLLFVLMVLFVYGIYTHQIKRVNQKKQIEIATNNKMVELRQNALSAMMNPHFVFNSLNAIQYFINSNQKEQSSEHLGKLARLVRLFLSQAAQPFITIDEEKRRLVLYLELEQVRFRNFEFVFHIDPKINSSQTKIPNMIVQPFVENAILHGVSHLKEKDGKIELNFQLDLDKLTIEIIDNGFGIHTNITRNDTHISKGIAIITERIEILQQLHPQKIFSLSQQMVYPDQIRTGHKVTIVLTILD